uniref:Putative plant transposon protein domain-containing protein n=1 Tax=Cajanus cajan TaxID=3821 RepID=A0A151TNE6_CAJCA|nr:hypothetical protein KK1_022216 [Cajanus cajan]
MASSSKRTHAGKSGQPPRKPNQPYSNLFLTERNETHFESISSRKFILERRVELEENEAPEFQAELHRRRWDKLGSYPLLANIAVVKEFCANALRLEEGIAPFTSYVRGVRVPYDARTINQFLGTELRADEVFENGNYTIDTMDPVVVEAAICMPGHGFHRNRSQQPLHVKRRDLLPVVRIWSALVHANILPCSHVSDLYWTRSMLMYCIMTQRTMDLGDIICMEISGCANSTPGSALGHPSLITQLCQLAGVDVHSPPFEGPGRAIDSRYISAYCQDCAPSEPLLSNHEFEHEAKGNKSNRRRRRIRAPQVGHRQARDSKQALPGRQPRDLNCVFMCFSVTCVLAFIMIVL